MAVRVNRVGQQVQGIRENDWIKRGKHVVPTQKTIFAVRFSSKNFTDSTELARLEKLVVTQLVKKLSALKEPKTPKNPSNETYTELDESSPHCEIMFNENLFQLYLPHIRLGLASGFFRRHSPTTTLFGFIMFFMHLIFLDVVA